MKQSEISNILIAIIILGIVSGFSFTLQKEWNKFLMILAFSTIIILTSIIAKKISSYLLDADVEHEIWKMKNFGFKNAFRLKKPISTGIIIPLIITIFSLGIIKFSALLTYETRALKYRAAKRFGFYSFKEMTDWHNALIGASGIISLFILTIITYLLPSSNLELLSKTAAYYSFWNLIPISKLDGTQIFFGSRILWSILITISAIFAFFALTI